MDTQQPPQRLLGQPDRYKIIADDQYGFCKRIPTEYAALDLKQHVEDLDQ